MSERGEQERGRGLVVPDVRTIAMTAAAIVVGALEAMELSVARAEAGGAAKGRKIGASGFLDDAGQGTLAKRGGKQARFGFETREMGGRVLGSFPGRLERSEEHTSE